MINSKCWQQNDNRAVTNESSTSEAWAQINLQKMGSPLPGTELLTWNDPLDVRMRIGINSFLDHRIATSVKRRTRYWNIYQSSFQAYEESVAPNRARLTQIIGAVDERAKPEMLGITTNEPELVAQIPNYTIYEVRWPTLKPLIDRTVTENVKQSDWAELTGFLKWHLL